MWFRRNPNPTAPRAKRVSLPEEATPAMKSLRRIAGGLRQQALQGLNENERENLVDILIHMKTNLLNLPVTDKNKT